VIDDDTSRKVVMLCFENPLAQRHENFVTKTKD